LRTTLITRAILDGRGHRTRAITLSDPQHFTLTGHVSEVLGLMENLVPERTVPVGHSYTGFVITGVAGRAPERPAGLVHVDSAIPRSGQSLWQVFESAGVDAARFGVPPWPPFTEPLVFDQAVIDRIPKTYVHFLKSRFLELTSAMPEYVKSRPRAQGWRYEEMDTDHYGMLGRPGELARILSGDGGSKPAFHSTADQDSEIPCGRSAPMLHWAKRSPGAVPADCRPGVSFRDAAPA